MIISSCSRRWAESEYYVSSSKLLLSECITLPTHSERLSRDDRPSRPHPRSDRPAPAARPEPSPPDAHQHISNQVMQGRRRVLTLLLPDTCRGRPRKRGSSPDPVTPDRVALLNGTPSIIPHSPTSNTQFSKKDLLAFHPNHTYP